MNHTVRYAFRDLARYASKICLLFISVIAIVACDRPPTNPRFFGRPTPKHGPDEFWLNNGSEPEFIDPGKCSDSSGGDVIWNTFAALTESHPKTLEPIPDIARRWDISDDGRAYTFHLRPSKWSDGKELTAHDFEWAWKRVLDPALASKYSIIMYPLTNAAAFNQKAIHVRGLSESVTDDEIKSFFAKIGEVDSVSRPIDSENPETAKTEAFVSVGGKDEERAALREKMVEALNGKSLGDDVVSVAICNSDVVGVKAIDDLTLKVTLKEPVPYFLSLINHYTFMPVPRHVIEDLEAKGIQKELWTRPKYHVGNGAYRLAEWNFRQSMVFEKNPHYWQADKVKIQRVTALMVESYNTCLNMYCAGDIDFPGGNTSLPSEFMDHLKSFEDYRNDDYLGVYFYWINTTEPPLDNPKLRKALSLAIDREKLCKYIKRAGEKPQADLVPDGLGGYTGLGSPIFDPAAAKAMLKESGYDPKKDEPIALVYNTSEGHKQIASAIQQMWEEHLGLSIAIENQEWNVFLGRLQGMDFQLSRMGWIGDYVDPNTFMELLASENGNNHSNWKDKKFDKMLNDANAERDPEKRFAMMREAEAYAMEQQPLIPIYMYTRANMLKPYVRGIWGNYQDRHLWKYISIDENWTGEETEVPDDPLPELPTVDAE